MDVIYVIACVQFFFDIFNYPAILNHACGSLRSRDSEFSELPVETSDNFYLLHFHVLEKMPKENVNASKIQRLSFKNLTQFVLWLKNQNGR